VGRDGCRVPIPWEAHKPAFGFSDSGKSWLPQPGLYKTYARDLQEGIPGSTLELYKRLLKLRKQFGMGHGSFAWADEQAGENSLAYVNNGILVIANFDGPAISVPAGEILVTTQHDLTAEGVLEHDQVAWIKL
jgi:alpha-glucosidase